MISHLQTRHCNERLQRRIVSLGGLLKTQDIQAGHVENIQVVACLSIRKKFPPDCRAQIYMTELSSLRRRMGRKTQTKKFWVFMRFDLILFLYLSIKKLNILQSFFKTRNLKNIFFL